MAQIKLTAAQRDMLRRVAEKPGESAYGLRTKTSRMEKLQEKGLVRAKSGPGSIWSPDTAITWTITKAGLAEIA